MSVQEFIDVSGTKFADAVCLVDATGVPYVAGGSSPGTGLSDIVCTDNTGNSFLARDNGTAITYVTFSGLAYTPTGPVKSSNASAANQVLLQTSTTAIQTAVANIPAQGLATMAHSTPMVMASDSPAMPMMINDGVNTAAVLKGSNGSVATQNAVLTAGTRYDTNFTFNSANTTLIIDAGNYAWLSLGLLTNGSPLLVYLFMSNDGTLYTPFKLTSDANSSSSSISGTAAGLFFEGAIRARYIKITSTGYTGTQGAYAAIEMFSQSRTSTNNVAATYDNQITGNTSLSSIAASNTSAATSLSSIATSTGKVGPATMANSMPMTIASDQSSFPVTVSGVSTSALQTTANSSLASIATNTGKVGQTNMANSIPMVIASDQTLAVLVNNSVATPANVSLAKGQAAMSASIPVTIASDQGIVPVQIGGYSFKNINFNVTTGTQVKAGSGTLHTLTIGSPGASGQAVLYDGISTAGIVIAYVNTSLSLSNLTFDCAFTTGLFVQFNISSGSAFSSFTVSYK